MTSTTIREFISRDLRRRIGSESGPPSNLTLVALSKFYGVSLTPVREAIRDLLAEGVLIKAENGRLSATGKSPESPGTTPEDRPDLEATLAAEIIARSLRGDEDYLREEATAQRLRVGRTAIRQVFGRLAGRGLLVHVPRCGWRIRRFDAADLDAYLTVRETLEARALDLAGPRLLAADLDRILAGNIDDPHAPGLDNALHRYLVEKAENPYIQDFFDRHGGYFTALLDYAAPKAHEVQAMAAQHREILRALLDHNFPVARRALIRHIRAQKGIVREVLEASRIVDKDTLESEDIKT